MEKIPFDIKFRSEIEAGKYLVVTREGRKVGIDRWDFPDEDYPIVAHIAGVAGRLTYTDKGVCDKNGYDKEFDLFLIPNPDYVDWDAFRRDAAKEFVGAILSNSAFVDNHDWEYRVNAIVTGVAYADELIKRLKEDTK